MGFSQKYTNTTDKAKIENKNKVVLADGDFALIEALYTLTNSIERLRMR